VNKKVVWLPYDFDTAIGINNEGSLVFSYNLEDIDTITGGADVFNGQQSVLWKNLRATYFEEIKAMWKELRSQGKISYEIVEQMFEEHQSKWPEVIFNEDAWFKYIDPLTEDNTASYLAMAQGSKAEQRKWWLYNRFRYIDSKYNAGDALTDVIQLRGYAKDDVSVIPYADIYPTVKYGSYLVATRGQRNVSTTLLCPLSDLNDTEIYIYSASQLKSVGDLSGFLVGFADFSNGTKLTSIKVGDDDQNYENQNLTELYVGNNSLLQTVDARNCSALAQAVDLSGATNVEYVYFDGTAITACNLPVGGILKVLKLPKTITNLTVRNQPSITTFSIEDDDYSGITTLRVENSASVIPVMDIVEDMSANSRIRIIGFTTTASSMSDAEDLFDLFDTMRGLDENGNNLEHAVVSGTITGIDTVNGNWLEQMHARYPNVTITYNHISCYLYYYNYDGTELLYTETVADEGDGAYSGTPARSSTAQYIYTFSGWSLEPNGDADANATKHLTWNRNVYAAYTKEVQKYTVVFKDDAGATLQTSTNIPYGSSVQYTGAIPSKTGVDDPEEYEFIGWNPSPQNITGDTTCYPTYRYNGLITRKLITRTIAGTVEESGITNIRSCAFAECSKLTAVSFPDVLSVGDSAFRGCTSLTTATMPSAEYIGIYAFENCSKLETVSLPSASYVGYGCFGYCSALESVNFPNLQVLSGQAFMLCGSLKTLVIGGSSVVSGGYSMLYGTNSMLSIYVPDSLVTAYQSANYWSAFASRIVGLSALVG